MDSRSSGKVSDFLDRDHRRLDALFEAFQNGGCFEAFRRELEDHIQWEEKILYPLILTRGGLKEAEIVLSLRDEHRLIIGHLEAFQEKMRQQDPEARQAEKRIFRLLVRHHVQQEALLYPVLDRCLSETDRALLLKGPEQQANPNGQA